MSEDPITGQGDDAGGEESRPGTRDRDLDAVVDDLDQPVLLFDGVCNLCNGFVRFVVKFDDDRTFLFAPLQSDVGQALLERHDLATDDFDTFVLIEAGEYATKSTAALRVLRRLDGPWPLLYPAIYLPRRVRDRLYEFVADHRYQVFGKKDACPVPEPELRERFASRTVE